MVDLANPTLAMGVRFPEQQQSVLANPLGMMKTMAETQNALIQAQTNRQILAARQKFGQIIATAPSYDAGIAAARLDPSISAFVPDLLGSLASTQQTRVATQGAEQDQGLQALHAVGQAFGAGATDPGLIEGQVTATLGALNPQSREVAVKAGKALAASVTANLPPQQEGESEADYAARLDAAVKKRSAGIAVANGYAPATVYAQTGSLPPQAVSGQFGPEGQQQVKTIGGSMTSGAEAAAGAVVPGAHNPDGSPLREPIQGPSAQKISEMTAAGKGESDIIQAMNEKANIFPVLKNLNMIGNTLQNFEAGGFASEQASAANFLYGLKKLGATGITKEMIDEVGNKSLGDTQTFQNVVKPMMVKFLSQANQGMGQVRTSELEAFLGAMSENDTPEALLNSLNIYRQSLQMDYAESQAFNRYAKLVADKDPSVAGRDLRSFETWYAGQFNFSKLPQYTAGGEYIGPLKTIKGAGTKEAEPKASPAGAAAKPTKMTPDEIRKSLFGG